MAVEENRLNTSVRASLCTFSMRSTTTRVATSPVERPSRVTMRVTSPSSKRISLGSLVSRTWVASTAAGAAVVAEGALSDVILAMLQKRV